MTVEVLRVRLSTSTSIVGRASGAPPVAPGTARRAQGARHLVHGDP
ncbi:hypothetical protein BJ994_002898 [Arthrobacter pigmenti]|uniref:Uncharacterized protein n=1 Tax=Arthrobacter pigmenti TaxID=271432 RepID=A0A846RTH6_9MICC|nr:hypothetical protein [Arthrobacter pigmenti]NJC23822.1 hypothetical protein [Arthrobacter pigmenti]